MANSFRRTSGTNQDNTGRTITLDQQTLAYAATLAPTITAEKTVISVGTLTGAMTVNMPTSAYIGDTVDMLFVADSGAIRVVTFSTNCAATGTLSVAASKFGRASLVFDGTRWIVSVFATA